MMTNSSRGKYRPRLSRSVFTFLGHRPGSCLRLSIATQPANARGKGAGDAVHDRRARLVRSRIRGWSAAETRGDELQANSDVAGDIDRAANTRRASRSAGAVGL